MDLPVNEANTSRTTRRIGTGLSYSALVSVSGLGGICLFPHPHQHLSVRAGNKVAGKQETKVHSWFCDTARSGTLVKNGLNSPDTTGTLAGVSPLPPSCSPDLLFLLPQTGMPVQCSHPVATACSFPLITCLYLFLTFNLLIVRKQPRY